MPSEEFDKKLREAADLHHPAYDEKAWEKMEALLDRHLPVEKKRRRRLLPWLFLFLVAGAGLFFWNPGGSSREERPASAGPATELKGNTSMETPPTPLNPSGPEATAAPAAGPLSAQRTGTEPPPAVLGPGPVPVRNAIASGPKSVLRNSAPRLYRDHAMVNSRTADLPAESAFADKTKSPDTPDKTNPVAAAEENGNASPAEKPSGQATVEGPSGRSNRHDPPVPAPADSTQNVSAENPETVSMKESVPCPAPPVAEKKGTKKSNRLFLTFSAGPDMSFVHASDPGRVRIQAGLGIGFTIRDRLTLRTGYNLSRKIYSAAPEAYKPPAVFWNYYPYLDAVEGDCRIAEIPLLMTWHVGRGGQRNWMLTAGVSSYLMKKEEYYYTYKNSATGPTLYRNWENHNRLNALFSVLSFSAGYRLTLSPRFQLLTEPYLRLPLTGVGYGNVRLNSGGIQFTLAGQLGRR